MKSGVEYKDRLINEISEAGLELFFKEMLRDSGERIEFTLGERPAGNFFKGKGMVRAVEPINDKMLLVVDTDRSNKGPFDINGDLFVWRKTLVSEGSELSRTDYPELHELYIVVSPRGDNYHLGVKQRLAYGGERTIGYLPEVKELLSAWIDGRKLPSGWRF